MVLVLTSLYLEGIAQSRHSINILSLNDKWITHGACSAFLLQMCPLSFGSLQEFLFFLDLPLFMEPTEGSIWNFNSPGKPFKSSWWFAELNPWWQHGPPWPCFCPHFRSCFLSLPSSDLRFWWLQVCTPSVSRKWSTSYQCPPPPPPSLLSGCLLWASLLFFLLWIKPLNSSRLNSDSVIFSRNSIQSGKNDSTCAPTEIYIQTSHYS